MLARRKIPEKYLLWNKKYGAPFGREIPIWLPERILPQKMAHKIKGPFSFQPNNDTRQFEYPWAFFAASIEQNMNVLEFGGGLSGFQFVLSKKGANVINVDPGLEAHGKGWPVSYEFIGYLNKIFKTNVELRNCFIDKAALEPNYYDRAFSISVMEHIPVEEIPSTMELIYKCLKPNSFLILTIDLFLDIVPFTPRKQNQFGSNISIKDLLNNHRFKRIIGIDNELYGFNNFNPETIQSKLSEYLIGSAYPTLVQCLVLQK